MICIDDCSTDDSVILLQKIKDPRLKIYIQDKNQGIVSALTKGIELSQGSFIARMDSDDLSMPDRIQEQINFLEENPDIDICATNIILYDLHGNQNGYWEDDIKNTTPEQIKKTLIQKNCIAHPTVVFRKSVFEYINYRHEYYLAEDWGLWLDANAFDFKIGKVAKPLLFYRVHPSSLNNQFTFGTKYLKAIRFKFKYLKTKFKYDELSKYDKSILISLLFNIICFPFDITLMRLINYLKH